MQSKTTLSTTNCQECPARMVCRCLQVTEDVLISALASQQIQDLKDLRNATGAGDGCMCCHRRLRKYLEQYTQAPEPVLEGCC